MLHIQFSLHFLHFTWHPMILDVCMFFFLAEFWCCSSYNLYQISALLALVALVGCKRWYPVNCIELQLMLNWSLHCTAHFWVSVFMFCSFDFSIFFSFIFVFLHPMHCTAAVWALHGRRLMLNWGLHNWWLAKLPTK